MKHGASVLAEEDVHLVVLAHFAVTAMIRAVNLFGQSVASIQII